MRPIARFTIRPNVKKDDLILGGVGSNATPYLKSGRIYEIRELLGELQIVDVGPSAIQTGRSPQMGANWNCDVNSIINNGLDYALMTIDEVNTRE